MEGVDPLVMLTREQVFIGRRYWLNHLSGDIPRSGLPVQYPKSAAFEHAVYTHEFPKHLSSRVLQISKGKKVTLYVALLAALQAWIAKVNGGQSDIAVTIPVLPVSAEDILGRSIIIRNDVPPEATFKEMLERVKGTVTDGYRHQYIGLHEISEQLGLPKEETLSTPLAIAMSGLHDEADIRLLCEGSHEVVIVVESLSEDMNLVFHYNGRLFAPEAMEIYARSFMFSLEQYLAFPDKRIGDALLLSKEEGEKLIGEFNDTDAAYSSELTIPALIEKQALLAPDNIAVCAEGVEITYGELNERANRLASLLIDKGIGTGSYAAILLDRSVEIIVGVLGILKAGAAYVPIEPGFPKARIETILRSLPIRCIVTKTAVMRPFQELIWKIEQLQDVVYMDVTSVQPSPEPVDAGRSGNLWDRVAEESIDRVTAGGFISSYSGLPFSEAEVDEYRDRVVELARPYISRQSSVLEIGCGSGLIAFNIAPMVNRFVGIDPSRRMLEMNRTRSAELQLTNSEWLEGYALQLEEMDESSFDLIIIASAAQFFPGYFYFERVVREAVRCLKPDGALIIADVMDLRRKEMFRDSILEYRKHQGMAANAGAQSDQELYCDESFFADLQCRIPDIGHAEIRHREEGFNNELAYRYDVIVRKGTAVGQGEAWAAEEERIARSRKRSWTLAHIDRYPNSAPRTALTSEHEAYVIFTSGTTGIPKGVVVRHRPVINLIEWVNRTFGVGEQDRLLFVTSLCFDLSVYDIFGTLASGGSIRIASENELSDRERLLDIVRQEPITFWDSAPAALQQLAVLMEIDSDGVMPNPNLRLVFLSGDWIPLTLPDVLKKHFPNVQVVALGGATEATVWSNYYPVRSVEEHWVSIPYGTPIQNARYYVLDSNLQPCPPFVPGDLFIGGECLASGYTDQRITEERFIADPYREQEAAGAKMYRTGDLARWMPDGVIEFLGRSDHQVKIRGYRIELGDIQAQLLKHPRVREALVTDWADSNGSKALCAYYTSSDELPYGELKEYLASVLPDYMIPAYFVPLPAMPITANGKINRSALPGPQDHMGMSDSYEAPENPQEERLAQIWQEVLGLERIGASDDFYALGGDSLKAVQVVAKASEYKVAIGLRDMLQYRTIREIVQAGGGQIQGDAAVGTEAAAGSEAECAMGTSDEDTRRYNTQFDQNVEDIPYYYPCLLGAIYTKLHHETGYPIPRGFLPVGRGLGTVTFSVPLSGLMEDRLPLAVEDTPEFGLTSKLGLEGRPLYFDSAEEALEWCEERMREGILPIGVGTTYFLNYTHDYLMDEDEYGNKLVEGELHIMSGSEIDIHHSHMFLLVDHTERGYKVYDSTYNFYGTIPEAAMLRSVAGPGSLEFLQRFPLKHANARNIIMDLSYERFQPIPLQQLALDLLEKHIQYYTSSEPFEHENKKRVFYSGSAVFQPFREVLEDAFLQEEFHVELYNFVIYRIRKWKYTYLFFRDFLLDAVPFLNLSSLAALIKSVENSIQCLSEHLDRLLGSFDTMNEEPAGIQASLQLVLDGLETIEQEQRKALAALQSELEQQKTSGSMMR